MGKVVKTATNALGFSSDTNAGAGAMGQSVSVMKDVLKRVDKIDLPDQEKMQIKFELQKMFMPEEGERVDVSQVKNILSQVPGGEQIMEEVQTQYANLAEQGGLGPEERAVFEQLQTEAARDTQAQMASLEQQMAERGMESSGLAAALKSQAIQQQAERSQQGARDLAAQSAAAKRDVLAQRAGLGSQLASSQSSRDRALANAELTGEQSRAALEQEKRGVRQAQEAERVGKGIQQQQYDADLERERFQSEMAKAQGSLGAAGGISQALANQGAAQAAAEQQKAAGRRALVQTGAQVGMMALSDEDEKKDISKGEGAVRKLLDKLDPYKYKYKDESNGPGEHLGIMAQDLEKSKEGSKYVHDTEKGKMVDYGEMAPTMLASLADMHERLKKVESGNKFNEGGIKKDALGMMLNKDKKYDYVPQMDAKEQIAQFNRLNGRQFNVGGIQGFDRAMLSPEKLAQMDTLFSGDDSQGELDAQTEDFNNAMSKNFSYDEAQNRTVLGKEKRDKESSDKLKKGLQGISDAANYEAPLARIGNVSDAIKRYSQFADGGMKEDLGNMDDSGQDKIESDVLGGLMPGDNEPLAELQGVFQELEDFDPEEIQRAIASKMEEIKQNVPEEEQESFQYQLQNIQDILNKMQSQGDEYADGGIENMSPNEFKGFLDSRGSANVSNDHFFNRINLTPDQLLMLKQKSYEDAIGSNTENIAKKQLLDLIDKTMVNKEYADGGMAYEDGGEGTIIPGENYAGDELPDRINSGEMVLNVEQQQNLLDELKQLKGKRVDEMLDERELEVNPIAQEKLLGVARGELPIEEIGDDENIIEAKGFKRLLGMLGR